MENSNVNYLNDSHFEKEQCELHHLFPFMESSNVNYLIDSHFEKK